MQANRECGLQRRTSVPLRKRGQPQSEKNQFRQQARVCQTCGELHRKPGNFMIDDCVLRLKCILQIRLLIKLFFVTRNNFFIWTLSKIRLLIQKKNNFRLLPEKCDRAQPLQQLGLVSLSQDEDRSEEIRRVLVQPLQFWRRRSQQVFAWFTCQSEEQIWEFFRNVCYAPWASLCSAPWLKGSYLTLSLYLLCFIRRLHFDT